jgi:hypothetical protein
MSILTSYRPNFCCECGEKIVRLRWRVWTSRKFCEQCFRAVTRAHWLQPVVTIAGLLLVGMIVGRGCRSAPPPLVIQRTVAASATTAPAVTQDPTSGATTFQQSPLSTVTEPLYTCGARTKKGTPCSRRVHGPVRCWQHKGAPAMLPLEKLRIKE